MAAAHGHRSQSQGHCPCSPLFRLSMLPSSKAATAPFAAASAWPPAPLGAAGAARVPRGKGGAQGGPDPRVPPPGDRAQTLAPRLPSARPPRRAILVG